MTGGDRSAGCGRRIRTTLRRRSTRISRCFPKRSEQMVDDQVFLRSKVIVEPLVDRFVAQPHTMAPIQASMNLAFLHVPLLESYLQSPQVHVAASVNPALRGGYFINIPE